MYDNHNVINSGTNDNYNNNSTRRRFEALPSGGDRELQLGAPHLI